MLKNIGCNKTQNPCALNPFETFLLCYSVISQGCYNQQDLACVYLFQLMPSRTGLIQHMSKTRPAVNTPTSSAGFLQRREF